MGTIITPSDVPTYVPGTIWLDGLDNRWNELSVRGYTYKPSDVSPPGLADYLLVLYRDGVTRMSRRLEGPRRTSQIVPGDISLLPRAVESEWRWVDDIEVLHIYLQPGLIARVANSILDRDIAGVNLKDILKIRDDVLSALGRLLVQEASTDEAGSRLYAEAIGQQIAVHLLRHYFDLKKVPGEAPAGKFDSRRIRQVQEFIEAQLGGNPTLASLADIAGVSPAYFSRLFRHSFGAPPHQYLLSRRLERARDLLQTGRPSIAEVASATGFSDQSHLTRHFKRRFGVTPHQYRSR
jgi:AraC family transcriptional regulator